MGKYSKREFQCGEWFLVQRRGSPAWYRARYVGTKRRIERVSLGTTDAGDAKLRLEEWWLKNREKQEERPETASLPDIFRRYWESHASKTPSASANRDAQRKWLDFWGDACVADITIPRQEKFVEHLEKLGNKRSTIGRVISIGKAAISWARKRGELTSVPYIASVTSKGASPPMGRPLSVDELMRIYANARPHVQTFILWMVATAARPAAILELTSDQVEFAERIVRLNPEGREQNKKHRPTVRLPPSLAGDVFTGRLIQYRGKNGWKAAVRKAGLDAKVRPYSLRHTAARWMRLQGVPAEEVAQQLGHRTLGVTAIYTEYDPAYLKNACAALDQLARQCRRDG